MFEKAKNFAKKAKQFDDENQAAKRNAPLWKVILNDGIAVFTVVAYIVLGAVWNLWHPAWLVFFIIPLYYTLMSAIKHKNPNIFLFPLLALGIFLLCGFIKPDIWHPAWAVLLSIPAYYLIVNLIMKRSIKLVIDILVPVMCAVIYVALGFALKDPSKGVGYPWHPAWVVFLAIPLYFTISASVQKYKKREEEANRSDNPNPYVASGRRVERPNDDDVIIK